MTQVGEEELGLRALAGQADLVLDLIALHRRPSASASCGHVLRRAEHTCTPSIATSTASGAVPGMAMPDRLDDPAPVRIAAVQRGLDQRRVGDSVRDTVHRAVVAAAHDDAADPAGALAVAHDVQRELAQQRVERLAEAQLVLGLGLDP